MPSLNRISLMGHLGGDPETRYTNSGTKVANFSLATNEYWRDATSGERRENTQWHRVVAYGKLAEICGRVLSKGTLAYVEGRLQYRSWQDNNGVSHRVAEVIAREVKALSGRDQRHPSWEEHYSTGKGGEIQEHGITGSQDDDIPF